MQAVMNIRDVTFVSVFRFKQDAAAKSGCPPHLGPDGARIAVGETVLLLHPLSLY